jgi:hypothetical protein
MDHEQYIEGEESGEENTESSLTNSWAQTRRWLIIDSSDESDMEVGNKDVRDKDVVAENDMDTHRNEDTVSIAT